MQTNTLQNIANETCPYSRQVGHNMNNRSQVITAEYVRFDFMVKIPGKV